MSPISVRDTIHRITQLTFGSSTVFNDTIFCRIPCRIFETGNIIASLIRINYIAVFIGSCISLFTNDNAIASTDDNLAFRAINSYLILLSTSRNRSVAAVDNDLIVPVPAVIEEVLPSTVTC